MHIEELAPSILQSHCEGLARQTLLAMWQQRVMMALFMLVPVAVAMIALLIVGARYTAETVLLLTFNRAVSPTGSQMPAIAELDASSLVDSAAPVIRSRSRASAVVTRFGLDKDPAYARQSGLALMLASLPSWLQSPELRATPKDLGTNAMLVPNGPRAYLIRTSRGRGQAVKPSNAVVLENLQEVSAASPHKRERDRRAQSR